MKLISRFCLLVVVVFFVSVANALPQRPYSPWWVYCLPSPGAVPAQSANMTLTEPNGSYRNVASTEIWSAQIQASKYLTKSTVRCWCKASTLYNWDSQELGPSGGYWTFIQHLSDKGETCTCPKGAMPMVEMDPTTCSAQEQAFGFFQCSGCATSSANSDAVKFGSLGVGVVATVVAGLVALVN